MSQDLARDAVHAICVDPPDIPRYIHPTNIKHVSVCLLLNQAKTSTAIWIIFGTKIVNNLATLTYRIFLSQ